MLLQCDAGILLFPTVRRCKIPRAPLQGLLSMSGPATIGPRCNGGLPFFVPWFAGAILGKVHRKSSVDISCKFEGTGKRQAHQKKQNRS